MGKRLEKILSIEEGTFAVKHGYSSSMDGYKITTDKQEILILIDNGQSCCEQWGYLSSEDNFADFIGASIKSINEVDRGYNTKVVDYMKEQYIGDGIFVNVETNKGTLQFVLYNEHNGYYGHGYLVRSTQLTTEGSL